MINSSHLTGFIDTLLQKLPSGLNIEGFSSLSSDLQNSLKAHLENTLSKLNLVTREEFDVQTQVLARTRQKLDHMEKILAKLNQSPLAGSEQTDPIESESSIQQEPQIKD